MNKKMTIVGALLMAVAVTGYSVSGTYAKYTTAGTMSDSARVAKWDYSVPNTLDLFSTTYDHADGNGEKIVAPGARNSYTFSIGGSSEVDAEIKVDVITSDEATKVAALPTGVLASKTITGDYDPIKYSLIKEAATDADSETVLLSEGTYSDLIAALENITAIGDYTITWEWPYEGNDVADTKLGNEIAAAGVNVEDYTVRLTVMVSATQTPAAGNAKKAATEEEPATPPVVEGGEEEGAE